MCTTQHLHQYMCLCSRSSKRSKCFMHSALSDEDHFVSVIANAQGYVDRDTGIAELEFIAEFVLTAGPLYKVCTCLRFEFGSCQSFKQK